MSRNRAAAAVVALLGIALTGGALGARAEEPLNLPIGDPARRERTAPLVLDGITDTATGQLLTPLEMAARLQGVRVLFVGESHDSTEFHHAQLATIKALAESGRPVLVGLEMYPYTEQTWLDQWNGGQLDEKAFVEQARWYRMWGFHWNYYRDIFLYAREHGIGLYGVNTPREVVSAVRKKGFENLTPEEAARIPSRIDTDDADHLTLFKAFFSDQDSMHNASMGDEMWKAMFRSQCTWDATMGYNAVRALEAHGDRNAIMVVLIGSGHVAYGLGAERQARLWFDGRMASLIPVPVENDEGKPPLVRASYANFLWGVAREKHALYPSLGLSTAERKDGEYPRVIDVAKDSVAAQAGFQLGDVLLSLDGTALTEKETYARLMSGKRWGDSAAVKLRRGEQELTLTAVFRRARDEKEAGAAEGTAKPKS